MHAMFPIACMISGTHFVASLQTACLIMQEGYAL
jgi:hypothetical protein